MRTRSGQKTLGIKSVNVRAGLMTTPNRASEARFFLRSPDPTERFVWDAVLAEKEA